GTGRRPLLFRLEIAGLQRVALRSVVDLRGGHVPPALDFKEEAPDLVRERAVANGRAAREALVGGEDPVVGIEVEDDRFRGDAGLFVGELAVLELQLPAAALVAADPDAPG